MPNGGVLLKREEATHARWSCVGLAFFQVSLGFHRGSPCPYAIPIQDFNGASGSVFFDAQGKMNHRDGSSRYRLVDSLALQYSH